jgi:hypothetical protein
MVMALSWHASIGYLRFQIDGRRRRMRVIDGRVTGKPTESVSLTGADACSRHSEFGNSAAKIILSAMTDESFARVPIVHGEIVPVRACGQHYREKHNQIPAFGERTTLHELFSLPR